MKLIIADSNLLIRAGLNAVLSQYADIEIVGEAATDAQLRDMAKGFNPDVVLIDFAAQNFSIDVVPAIHKQNKHTRFVAITGEQSGITIVNA